MEIFAMPLSSLKNKFFKCIFKDWVVLCIANLVPILKTYKECVGEKVLFKNNINIVRGSSTNAQCLL